MTNSFNDISVGMLINNPAVGTFVVAAINEEDDRVLLVNTSHDAFNLYVGAWALQKMVHGDGWYWGQGHYFGGDFNSATQYVLGTEDKKKTIYTVVSCCEREIVKIGEADTLEEASEIMLNDFLKVFIDRGYTEEEFEETNGECDDWFCGTRSAWLNAGDNFDWNIIKVEAQL